MEESIDEIFCSVCGRELHEMKPYGEVVAHIGGRIENRECVIKSSRQDDGRVYVALTDPASPEANRLEQDLLESEAIISVYGVDGGLVVTPNLIVGSCECGQRTIVEVDQYVKARHVRQDYAETLMMFSNLADKDVVDMVEKQADIKNYSDEIQSIIDAPYSDESNACSQFLMSHDDLKINKFRSLFSGFSDDDFSELDEEDHMVDEYAPVDEDNLVSALTEKYSIDDEAQKRALESLKE